MGPRTSAAGDSASSGSGSDSHAESLQRLLAFSCTYLTCYDALYFVLSTGTCARFAAVPILAENAQPHRSGNCARLPSLLLSLCPLPALSPTVDCSTLTNMVSPSSSPYIAAPPMLRNPPPIAQPPVAVTQMSTYSSPGS